MDLAGGDAFFASFRIEESRKNRRSSCSALCILDQEIHILEGNPQNFDSRIFNRGAIFSVHQPDLVQHRSLR